MLVEMFETDGELPLYFNMYLIVPAAALALAIIVIVVSSYICCRQMKNVQQPLPQQGENRDHKIVHQKMRFLPLLQRLNIFRDLSFPQRLKFLRSLRYVNTR